MYLTEADVARLVPVADAVEAVEACFARLAAGIVRNRPRTRLTLEGGALGVMAAVDDEVGIAAAVADGPSGAVVTLFEAASGRRIGVVEADAVRRLAAGAASAVAVRHLARHGASTVGIVGCGPHALAQIEAIRAALPSLERVVAYCRTESSLGAFCEEAGAEPAQSHADAAEQDVVVTATTSRDPVVRGEWLRDGALVCAAGANARGSRELDNVVLERAAFVCCDSLEQAQVESEDLVEPVETGALDWLEVHELQEVVAGGLPGRQADADVVVFKSNGIAASDLAVAALALERATRSGLEGSAAPRR